MHLLCHDEAGAHAGIGRGVPVGVIGKALGLCAYAERFGPERKLLGVRAGIVAAGDEFVLAVGYLRKRVEDAVAVLDTGGIVGRAAQHEVVVHKAQTLGVKAGQSVGKALADESLLLLL